MVSSTSRQGPPPAGGRRGVARQSTGRSPVTCPRGCRPSPPPEAERALTRRCARGRARAADVRKDGSVCTSYEALGRFLENVVAKLEHGEGVPPLRWHDDAVRGMLARFNADPKHVAHRSRVRRRPYSPPAKASRDANEPTAPVRTNALSSDSGETSDGGTQSQASS
jgi:hypothetical protein